MSERPIKGARRASPRVTEACTHVPKKHDVDGHGILFAHPLELLPRLVLCLGGKVEHSRCGLVAVSLFGLFEVTVELMGVGELIPRALQ